MSVVISLDDPVSVPPALRPGATDKPKLSSGGGVHVAGQCSVLVAERVYRRLVFFDLRDGSTHFRRADEVLADEHAADNQADDDQHYRKFDEREARRTRPSQRHTGCRHGRLFSVLVHGSPSGQCYASSFNKSLRGSYRPLPRGAKFTIYAQKRKARFYWPCAVHNICA